MPAPDDRYIMRVFGRRPGAPSAQAIRDHLRGRRFEVRVESGLFSITYEGWKRLHVFYAAERAPLEIERQSLHGDAPLSDRLRALLDATAASKDGRGKRRVLHVLAEASQVFELILPPDYDWHAGRHLVSTELLNYLQKQIDGLVQADEEGYYDRNRVILKLG